MSKSKLVKKLARIVGKANVLWEEIDLLTYGYDGSLEEAVPEAVVFPTDTSQVSQLARTAYGMGVPFVARGAGTNISGGSVPVRGGIVIEFSRMNKILEVDIPNKRAVVEPGVVNIDLQNALAPYGCFYAPDPASQNVSTLGGNVAENSGGPHCLKYGVTTNHVLGLEIVLPDGDVLTIGSKALDCPGYDLTGLLVGSEGTLAIVTKIVLRVMRKPEAVRTFLTSFDSLESGGATVSAIIAAGIIPAALEMMDQPMVQAVEDSFQVGYPRDAAGVVIIELEGMEDEVDRLGEQVVRICQSNGATQVRGARDEAEREQLWLGRRGALGAAARLCPNYMLSDGTVPRTKLPEVIREVSRIGEKYDLFVGNVFHAGDGNLHPLLFFDARDQEMSERVSKANMEILKACVDAQGTITGEHGIGTEKLKAMPVMFSSQELALMRTVKQVFDPQNLCNPGKVLPKSVTALVHNSSRRPNEVVAGDDSFEELVGKEGVSVSADGTGYALHGSIPRMVLFPENTEQLAAILRLADEREYALSLWGGGTKRWWGGQPTSHEAVLCLSRMGRIIEHDPENLTVTVEAGMEIGKLRDYLAARGQLLPLSLSFGQRATIGGTVAAGASGPERLCYGGVRDVVLGMKVVLSNGDIVSPGGKTVKNVAGYDLKKLFPGSMGTLGAVAEVTLRLLPLPECERTVLASFPSVDRAVAAATSIMEGRILPRSLQVLNGEACRATIAQSGLGSYSAPSILVADVEGFKEPLERQIETLIALCRKEGGLGGQLYEERWEAAVPALAGIYSGTAGAGDGMLLKASTPISMLAEVVRRFEALPTEGAQPAIVADVGNGILRCVLRVDQTCDGVINAVKELSAVVSSEFSGHVVAEIVPPEMDIGYLLADRQATRLSLRLKKALDPDNILNRGKFPGFSTYEVP